MSLKLEVFIRKLLFRGRVRNEEPVEEPLYPPDFHEFVRWFSYGHNPTKLMRIVFDFTHDVPLFKSYVYGYYMFSGKVVREKLIELAGPDADYIWAFMVKNKVVRKVGFGKFDGTLSDDTLYSRRFNSWHITRAKLQNKEFPEEAAYIARHETQEIVETSEGNMQQNPEN
uniref:Acyltransf_C domain-containing protein n=1 Tax=Panagrellus redivivus TaxID=6233 RepID=A0A7E4V818_PANRE